MKSVALQYIEEGIQIGEKNGEHKASLKIATTLIETTDFDDQKIAEVTNLDIKEVAALRNQILDQQKP